MDTYSLWHYVWLSAHLRHIKTYRVSWVFFSKDINVFLLMSSIPAGGIPPLIRHEVLGPLQGSYNPLTIQPCPWRAHGEMSHFPANPVTSSSRSSHPPQLPRTSSIDDRTTLAAPTLQSASAEPHTLQPWPGSRVWMEPRAIGQWSIAQWSCSSIATRHLWSERLSAPSYMAARVRHLLYQSLGAGQSRSRGDVLPSQPSDLGTRTPDRRTRKAMWSQSNGGRGSGSHGGKAPRWGGVQSEGCSLDMLL